MSEAESVESVLARLRHGFGRGVTRPLAWRRQQLRQLRLLLQEHGGAVAAALAADLGKPAFEACLTETGFVREEIDLALARLASWNRPRRVGVPLRLLGAKAEIRPCPYGTVLILAPWNYPVQLALVPLVSALAAGNCVVLKPSELAPASSALLARLVPEYLDREAVAVVGGGAEVAAAWAAQPVDYIFFTGSTAVGRKVMAAAAPRLTPLTLELGGKSPCVVEASADLAVAARRIIWGKCLNAGQTCVAPDYVLADQRIVGALTEACIEAIRAFFGPDPQHSADYGRIIHAAHVRRLQAFLEDGVILHGGRGDPAERYLEPTLLGSVSPDSAVMQEEIFGPVLPILPYADLAEAMDFINRRPTPLALYVFSASAAVADQILAQVRCGGACVNDVMMHLTVHDLPFGGLGASGLGSCHGRAGFDTFSHHQSVLTQRTWPDFRLRYPPYGALAKKLLSGGRFAADET